MHSRSTRPWLVSAILVTAIATVLPASATDEGTRLLRDPDVGQEHIVFVHAHDLWLVPRDGGDAVRLTSGVGGETDPAFSPDGAWIAYSGEHGGNEDVYIIPSTGGQPIRLTWHPGDDVVQGWTPDGDVLFRSGRFGVPTRLWQFFTVSPEGGMPQPLPLPQAFTGEMSADGTSLAYQEIGFWDPEWRNYRGGQAQPVSVVDTTSWERTTPPWEGERHMSPVWLDGVVYYISERDLAANVWSWNPATGEERQCTFHRGFDVKSIGAGHGVVVYEQGGYLHEYDPAAAETRQLTIRVAADRTWSRPRWAGPEAGDLSNARLSPTGQRALFEYRGELLTVPAEHGSWRNITRTPGVADRHPVWSPDGQSIAWFNDANGEYALVVADQTGTEARRITIDEPSFYFRPSWSPDGTHLAFTDTHYRVLILNLETGAVEHIDTDRYAHPQRTMNPVWSPDSRFIAYARRLDNQLRAIFVHDTSSGKSTQITDGMADTIDPVWDADGEHLYFLASTDYGLNTGWLDMTSYDRPVTRSLYVAILAADGVSPFLARSDEEMAKDDETAKDDAKPKDDADSSSDEIEVVLDFEGLTDRIVAAPGLDAAEYIGLAPAPAGSVFVLEAGESGSAKITKYVLEDRKAEGFVDTATALTVSFDRKKMLYRSGPRWSIVGTASAPSGKGDHTLDLGNLRVKVDPPAEWRQMLRDGWRFMRDFLYVDNVHGAPWDEVWTWYEPWLDDVHHRSDFNHLLDILSGEVAVGHSYVRGGDYPDLDNSRVGLLGADFEVTSGALRIARIYTGERWNPDTPAPLAAPGLEVAERDVILAVDGRPWTVGDNPYRLLEGTAGREITLTVADSTEAEETRTIVVQPTSTEFGLRYWDWVERNRRTVDRLSEGRLAYVWLPDTGRMGYQLFNRMYFAQQDRQGAVIDERNNGGGSAADYIVEVLGRELTGYFNSRAGDRKPFTQPMAGLFGPKVMIINERAGSGGDLLPYLFRLKGIGPLIGTRTWGGLVGTWDTPPLIDGGRFVAPRGGFFDLDGEWAVEGEGVAPDIEVRNDPAPVIAGEDPQLDAAVAEALRLLETERVELKPEPAPPVRWRRPDPR